MNGHNLFETLLNTGSQFQPIGLPFRPLVHYFYIPGIDEEPVALCARQFPDNAQMLQMTQALVDRGRSDTVFFTNQPAVAIGRSINAR